MKNRTTRKPFRSISRKLILTLTIATTIPMLIFCIYFSFSMRKSSEEYYLEQAEHILQTAANNIDRSLSNCINVASRGIYYNTTLQQLIYSKDPNTFYYAESPNCSQVFSYMNSIYSLTPDAVQIHFSAYRTEKSFLLLTSNLQRYLKNQPIDHNMIQPPVKAFHAYILPPHAQSTYGHQWTHISSDEQEKQLSTGGSDTLVFTICLPIYHLPQTKDPIGELHIDISLDFFEKYCGYLYGENEAFYIVDSSYRIIFASDKSLIGKGLPEYWMVNLITNTFSDEKQFVHERSDDTLRICQKIPGDAYKWYMIKAIPEKVIYQKSHIQLAALLTAFGICLALAMVINSYFILNDMRPLKKATDYLNTINRHHSLDRQLSDYVTYEKEDEIGILLRSLDTMVDTINNFVIRQYELDILNRTTELKMLQAQINPHFIYNTLQCLATKSLEHNDRKQYDYISSFGQLLQYAMDTKQTLVTIGDEISHIERYIKLQKMRFTSDVTIDIQVAESIRRITVPKMILQPLIENSIKHGNLFRQDFGMLIIQAKIADGRTLHLDVIDNGCHPDEKRILDVNRQFMQLRDDYTQKLLYHDINSEDTQISFNQVFAKSASVSSIKNMMENLYTTNSIGMNNVYLRILLYFGKHCHMELRSNDLGGTTVHMEIAYKNLWKGDSTHESTNRR